MDKNKEIAFLVYDTLFKNTQFEQLNLDEVIRKGVDTTKDGEYFIYFEFQDGREIKLLVM